MDNQYPTERNVHDEQKNDEELPNLPPPLVRQKALIFFSANTERTIGHKASSAAILNERRESIDYSEPDKKKRRKLS